MTVYCCSSVSLCNCVSAHLTLSLNLSTPLYIRWELSLLGARWLLPQSGGFLRYLELECSLPMSTLWDYGVTDASHVAMFIDFGGTCVSDNQVGTFCWLWRFKPS